MVTILLPPQPHNEGRTCKTRGRRCCLQCGGHQFGGHDGDGGQEGCAADVRGAIAEVLIARAAVLDAYVGRRVDGARPVVVPAVRRPRARPDDHQLSVHCAKHKSKIEKLTLQ